MSHFFKRALGLWASGAALLACVWSTASAQAQVSTPSAPASAHVHGAQPTVPVPVPPDASAPTRGAALGWQDANRAVAQFPRGHADVLRWEQKNTPQSSTAPVHPDAGQLTLARATRLAMQDQTPWIKPGMGAQDIAETRQQAAALRWAVQKQWVDAVAARQSVAHSRDILAVAQAGAELAQRMAQVGNWSRVRQIQEELPLWDAHSRLANAEWQAERALNALWQRIGAGMTLQALAQQLPAYLPLDLPAAGLVGSTGDGAGDQLSLKLDDVAALQAQALQAHVQWGLQDVQARRLMAGLGLSATDLQAAQNALNAQAGQDVPVWDPRTMRWGHDFENAWQARTQADRLARQVRADVQVAVAAYKLARQNAHTSRAEVLRLHNELTQETALRYNGMLQSTWDLLASARTRTERVDAALQAQRQAWLAQADLMAVLAGLPYSASTDAAGTPSPSNTNSTGH
ncbi:MAG: hypothetical protein AAB176_14085 [Pseudomonadota bacterium]